MSEATAVNTGTGTDTTAGVVAAGPKEFDSAAAAAAKQLMDRLTQNRGALDPKLLPIKTKLDYLERELQRMHQTIQVKSQQPHLCLDDDNNEINEIRSEYMDTLTEFENVAKTIQQN